MALTAYLTALTNLLQTPQQPLTLIPTVSQTVYINQARQFVAAEGECVAVYGSLDLVVDQQSYPFSEITFGGSTSVNAVNAVRTIWYQIPGATGQQWITPRQFEWFGYYHLNDPAPEPGAGPQRRAEDLASVTRIDRPWWRDCRGSE